MISKFKNSIFYLIVREIRVRQWIKNFFVFGPIVLKKALLIQEYNKENILQTSLNWTSITNTFIAFFAFSFAASFVYIVNDIVDINKDRLHPVKKNRPIASGKLNKNLALFVGITFLFAAFFISYLVNTSLLFIIFGYVLLQLAYSFYFKNIIIVDALTVSIGFIARVFAGGVAAGVGISSWLILSVIGISLLLAFGKRRGERTFLLSQNMDLKTRDTLKGYPDTLLDSMITMSATYTIFSYTLFIYFTTDKNVAVPTLFKKFFPVNLSSPRWLMLTIPFVIYGVGRYLYIIYEKKQGEHPERAILYDTPFLICIFIWSLMILFFYYVLGYYCLGACA